LASRERICGFISQIQDFCVFFKSLSHDGPDLVQFLEDIPVRSLHGLGGLDYRKSLSAEIMVNGTGLFAGPEVLGFSGLNRVIDDASLRSLKADHFEDFNPEAFLRVRSSIPAISRLLLRVLM
jgi:hypothetical protein